MIGQFLMALNLTLKNLIVDPFSILILIQLSLHLFVVSEIRKR